MQVEAISHLPAAHREAGSSCIWMGSMSSYISWEQEDGTQAFRAVCSLEVAYAR